MKDKYLFWVVLAILVVGLVYWKRNEIKKMLGKKEASDPNPATGGSGGSSGGASGTYTDCPQLPLKLGCKGNLVTNVQKALNKLHQSGLKEDGYFGQNTLTALQQNGYGDTIDIGENVKFVQALNN